MNDKSFKITLGVSFAITFLLSAFCFYYGLLPGIVCLLCSGVAIVLFVVYTKKRFKRISELNNYLSAVCSGKFDLDLPDNSEGELSILKNNLYKIITMLKYQKEEKEKAEKEAKKEAEDIIKKLDKGEDFEKLAKKYSNIFRALLYIL